MAIPLIISAQSARFDDFKAAQPWWQFHRDGTAAADSGSLKIENGYLVLKLANPDAGRECNVGISDPQNVYSKAIDFLSFEARVKILTLMKPGSRGCGFWKAARGGRASSLAWFMQQLDTRHDAFSWSRMGVISRRKTAFRDWQIRPGEWHVYGVERDRTVKTTRFFIDGEEVYTTPGLVPLERMSFHLWIDNQVYSRKRGILRKQWPGVSALIVDYVKIDTQRPQPQIDEIPEPVVFFERFKIPRAGAPLTYQFTARGDTVYLLTSARAEYNAPFGAADTLILNWNGRQELWAGDRLRGTAQSVLLTARTGQKAQTLEFSAKETPLLSYAAALSYPGLHLLLDSKKDGLTSSMDFRSQHKNLLLCLGLRQVNQAPKLSAAFDGKSLNKEIRQRLQTQHLLGVDRLLFIEISGQPGKHQLKIAAQSLAWMDRLLLFSWP